jgi:hypothetical protein
MQTFPRLLAMWRDDPADPGRLPADDPRVEALIRRIAPGAAVTDLGGTYSLNVLLEPAGIVLRVHQPFVSRNRLLALQALKHSLAARGVCVAPALAIDGDTVLRSGDRWAEVAHFRPGKQPCTIAGRLRVALRRARAAAPASGGGRRPAAAAARSHLRFTHHAEAVVSGCGRRVCR